MSDLFVHDWDEHQSYRRDRPPPPWIKVHRRLFMSRKWAQLSDSEKGQLVSLWILAADKEGAIPSDPYILRKLAQLDTEPNVNKFMELGFLTSDGCQDGVKLTPDGYQSDAPEAEAEAEAEAEDKNLPASPQENFDIEKDFFDMAVEILSPFIPDKRARSMAAKLRSVCPDVLEASVALQQAEGKDDPVSYLGAIIRGESKRKRELTARDDADAAAIVKQLEAYR